MTILHRLLLASTVLLAFGCSPKINPIAGIKNTSWEPMYVANTKGLKIPSDAKRPARLNFDKNLNITGFDGVNEFSASCALKRKPIRRSECKICVSEIACSKASEDFADYEKVFLDDIKNADAIRLSANKLEFLKGRKLLIEFKRVPHELKRK
ncbi:MAG: META domain-containing protein [Opitutales bacterium]|nr:META domain-containing protein [Opitutales bacterium]